MGAIRLFLASVVVISHLQIIVLYPRGLEVAPYLTLGLNGGYAVMFFYMISGFLIGYALDHKYRPDLDGTREFYISRFARIFSLYWPLALLVLVFSEEARSRFMDGSLLDKATGLSLFGLDWDLAFGTYPEYNTKAGIWALGQAWTLGAELTFYALAPYLLRSIRAVITVLLGSLALRLGFHYLYDHHVVWSYFFFPSTVVFFLLGFCGKKLSDKFTVLQRPPVGISSVLFVCGFLMLPTFTGWDTARFWAAILAFAIGLPAIFAMSKDNALLNTLGDLSYPLYLTHLIIIHKILPAIGIEDRIFFAGPYLAVTAILLFCIVSAALVRLTMEEPVRRVMHRVIKAGCDGVARVTWGLQEKTWMTGSSPVTGKWGYLWSIFPRK